MLFLCHAYPYLRVYDPETGDFIGFTAGRLQLDPGDPGYEVVLAEGMRNPSITMLSEAISCPDCNEPFSGKAAAASLGRHRKEAHFEQWAADKEQDQGKGKATSRVVKRKAIHACDICNPAQEFGSDDELAIHVRAVHLTVDVDDNGNVFDGDSGGPASVTVAEPPAAKAR